MKPLFHSLLLVLAFVTHMRGLYASSPESFDAHQVGQIHVALALCHEYNHGDTETASSYLDIALEVSRQASESGMSDDEIAEGIVAFFDAWFDFHDSAEDKSYAREVYFGTAACSDWEDKGRRYLLSNK